MGERGVGIVSRVKILDDGREEIVDCCVSEAAGRDSEGACAIVS